MPAPSRGPLSRKQLFAEEYCVDLNATQAAIRAGYAKSTAGAQASNLLKDVGVATRIKEILAKRAEKTEITQERVLEEFATAAFLDPQKMFLPNGQLMSIHDMDPRVRRAIASFEVEEIFEGHGENRVWIGYLKKVKLVSKEGTLNSTAKHLGMFIDRVQLDANVTFNIVDGVPSGEGD